MRLKSSEKCERGMTRMSGEGGQLLLPLLSFIINSNVPPKVVVSNWGAIGDEAGKYQRWRRALFLITKNSKIRIFRGRGAVVIISSFWHFSEFSLAQVNFQLTSLPQWCTLNPLCPNSVQNQFSPNDIHRLSRAKSTRINKMILKRKIFDLLSNSLN